MQKSAGGKVLPIFLYIFAEFFFDYREAIFACCLCIRSIKNHFYLVAVQTALPFIRNHDFVHNRTKIPFSSYFAAFSVDFQGFLAFVKPFYEMLKKRTVNLELKNVILCLMFFPKFVIFPCKKVRAFRTRNFFVHFILHRIKAEGRILPSAVLRVGSHRRMRHARLRCTFHSFDIIRIAGTILFEYQPMPTLFRAFTLNALFFLFRYS